MISVININNKPRIVLDGHTFHRNNIRDEYDFFVCSLKKSKKCKASMSLATNQGKLVQPFVILRSSLIHSHDPPSVSLKSFLSHVNSI
jgi:hypothetical protein